MPEPDVLPSDIPSHARPTAIRYLVLGTAFCVAVLLYLHRFILSYAEQYVREDLRLSDTQISWCQSAFFLTYALAQVPSGRLADRFGARRMLTFYILVWSGFTVCMGYVGGLVSLLLVRAAVGLGQAGAYPTCAVVVGKWAPFGVRALVSSVIALGGRVGGAIAPILVSLLIVAMVPATAPEKSLLTTSDILNPSYLIEQLDLSAVPLTKASDETRARQAAAVQIRKRLPAQFWQGTTASVGGEGASSNPRKFGDKPAVTSPPAQAGDKPLLVRELNVVLSGPLLLTPTEALALPVEKEATRLWALSEVTAAQRTRLNRLILESACSKGVRKVYADGWRPVMILLGSLGVVAALAWVLIVRNRPQEHSLANAAECELIAHGAAPASTRERSPFPWKTILASRSLWNLGVSQLGTNIGWVFLMTMLPRYLQEVYEVPFETRGIMIAVPLWIGATGMLAGGWATDGLTRKRGLKIGRSWPVGLSRFVGAAAFGAMLLHPSHPWLAIMAFAVVAFSTDFSSPPMWAYSQDVGGRHTAAVLGWSNMWGNLGAVLSTPLMNWLLGPSKDNWDVVFALCAGAFVLAGITGMFIDATKRIDVGGVG